jgi:hypothetical protein
VSEAVALVAGRDEIEVAALVSATVGGDPMTRNKIFRFASTTKQSLQSLSWFDRG